MGICLMGAFSLESSNAFSIMTNRIPTSHPSTISFPTRVTQLGAAEESANGDEEEDLNSTGSNNSNNNATLVTRETFQREMLKDPVVKRKHKGSKNGGKSYKVLDNRDSMPFQVEHVTPDPYTHPETKRKKAKKVTRRPGSIEDGFTPSAVFMGGENGADDTKTRIGEFLLDKLTTTGDLLEIGDIQYRVTKHKCLYKYAGGKRFVMTKKILQVKEVGRLMAEEYLSRQWENSAGGGE